MQWIKCCEKMPDYDGKTILFKVEEEIFEGWYLPPLFLSNRNTPPSVFGKDVGFWKLKEQHE